VLAGHDPTGATPPGKTVAEAYGVDGKCMATGLEDTVAPRAYHSSPDTTAGEKSIVIFRDSASEDNTEIGRRRTAHGARGAWRRPCGRAPVQDHLEHLGASA